MSALLLAFTAQIFLSHPFERDDLTRELDTLTKIVAENSAGVLLFREPQACAPRSPVYLVCTA